MKDASIYNPCVERDINKNTWICLRWEFILLIVRYGKHWQPKILKLLYYGYCLKSIKNGLFIFNTVEGNRLMRYTVVRNAFTHRINGSLSLKSIVRPISTICLCFLSTTPFCSRVPRHEIGCKIPHFLRWFWNLIDWNSPPPSLWKIFVHLSSWFSTKIWNFKKHSKKYDFLLKG